MTTFRCEPTRAGAIAVFALLAACRQTPAGNDEGAQQQPSRTKAPVVKATAGGEKIMALPLSRQQDLAFRTVFHHPTPYSDESGWITKAERLIWLGDRAILVASKAQDNACHACEGSLGLYYLKRSRGNFEVVGRFDAAVHGNGFGEPPEWSITHKFGKAPVIYAEMGWTGQGYTCTTFTLTELAATGPKQLAVVPIYYSDKDSGAGDTELSGSLGEVKANRAFTINYSGSAHFSETWKRRDNEYILASPSQMKTC